MANILNEALAHVAETLVGEKISGIEQATGGGNSRIYKIIASGRAYALKRYPTIDKDPRDRFAVEKQALQFFEKNNIACVPRWLGGNAPFALMQWIDGIMVTEPTAADIDQAVAFLAAVHGLSRATPPDSLPMASEACLSAATIISQIEKRLARLKEAAGDDTLSYFLKSEFTPAMQHRLRQAEKTYAQAGWDFASELPQEERALIPADFGFHNALRTSNNQLIFIDFEYFGWDDPVKLLCDFLLHPAMALSSAQRAQFLSGMRKSCDYTPSAKARFSALYPLFGLRWTLILLNEFLPERWQARADARGENDWQKAKDRQLQKAQTMLAASAAIP